MSEVSGDIFLGVFGDRGRPPPCPTAAGGWAGSRAELDGVGPGLSKSLPGRCQAPVLYVNNSPGC